VESPEELVERCLDLVGPLPVTASTQEALQRFAARRGPLEWGPAESATTDARIAGLLSFIVSSREYQFC